MLMYLEHHEYEPIKIEANGECSWEQEYCDYLWQPSFKEEGKYRIERIDGGEIGEVYVPKPQIEVRFSPEVQKATLEVEKGDGISWVVLKVKIAHMTEKQTEQIEFGFDYKIARGEQGCGQILREGSLVSPLKCGERRENWHVECAQGTVEERTIELFMPPEMQECMEERRAVPISLRWSDSSDSQEEVFEVNGCEVNGFPLSLEQQKKGVFQCPDE
jgi:hypothetical protein